LRKWRQGGYNAIVNFRFFPFSFLQDLNEKAQGFKKHLRLLADETTQRFAQLGQAKPAEVDRQVAILELLSEKVLAAMEDKETDAKRARTIRYEYQRDVENVQSWICQAEGRVQDRSLEPQTLRDFLQVMLMIRLNNSSVQN